ncbi:hypothetical protein ART_0835 [Arthrobacter sp. PAMC 25486]|nr:hypothetical protein ART_0835 [Arthrobacter sp. PAMC 25486]
MLQRYAGLFGEGRPFWRQAAVGHQRQGFQREITDKTQPALA